MCSADALSLEACMALEELCAWAVQADAEHSSSHIRYLKNKIAKATSPSHVLKRPLQIRFAEPCPLTLLHWVPLLTQLFSRV